MVTKNSWARTWPGVCRLTYPTLLIFRLLPILIYIGRYPVVSVFLLTTQKILLIFSRHYHNNPNYLIVKCLLKASRFRFTRTETHYLLHSVSKKGLRRRLVDQFVCLKLQPPAWDIRAASRVLLMQWWWPTWWRLIWRTLERQLGLPGQSLVGQKRSHPEEGEGAAYHEVALCLHQWLSCDFC